jgi:hypothetical protein
MDKPLKVGAHVGGGPPPGYLWSVYFLSMAREEAMGFLDAAQYAHTAGLFKALASEADPTHPLTVRVQGIEDYFELKDKGGILGKINLRVFFVVDQAKRAIVVLAAVKKEEDGATPMWMEIRVRHRLRRYRAGEFGVPE